MGTPPEMPSTGREIPSAGREMPSAGREMPPAGREMLVTAAEMLFPFIPNKKTASLEAVFLCFQLAIAELSY